MNDPVSGRLLPDPFLDERLLGAEQLHGQLVVRRLEDVLQLVAYPPGLRVTRHRNAPEKCMAETE